MAPLLQPAGEFLVCKADRRDPTLGKACRQQEEINLQEKIMICTDPCTEQGKDQQLAQSGGAAVQSTIHTRQYKKQGEKYPGPEQQGQGA